MDLHAKLCDDYQKKDYSSCLRLIAKAPKGIREIDVYRVLKASCLVNQGTKINEAHQLLDGVIAKETNNAFAFYAKGLAFMHQKDYKEAVNFFDKAIEHDRTGSMQMAKQLRDDAIKTMTNDEVGGANKENMMSDTKQEISHSENKLLTTTMTTVMATTVAEVNKVSKVQEENKPQDETNTCTVCSKSFNKKFSLIRHMVSHTGERPFVCDHCDQAFTQKFDLKRHETIHSDEFNFECPTCSRKFRTKKTAQAHQSVHKDEPPFKCALCQKTFKLEKFLSHHQKIHEKAPEKQPNFECDVCGKKFLAKTYIESHIKSHFNTKLFTCNLCKFTYSTITRFGNHFREFHIIGKGNV